MQAYKLGQPLALAKQASERHKPNSFASYQNFSQKNLKNKIQLLQSKLHPNQSEIFQPNQHQKKPAHQPRSQSIGSPSPSSNHEDHDERALSLTAAAPTAAPPPQPAGRSDDGSDVAELDEAESDGHDSDDCSSCVSSSSAGSSLAPTPPPRLSSLRKPPATPTCCPGAWPARHAHAPDPEFSVGPAPITKALQQQQQQRAAARLNLASQMEHPQQRQAHRSMHTTSKPNFPKRHIKLSDQFKCFALPPLRKQKKLPILAELDLNGNHSLIKSQDEENLDELDDNEDGQSLLEFHCCECGAPMNAPVWPATQHQSLIDTIDFGSDEYHQQAIELDTTTTTTTTTTTKNTDEIESEAKFVVPQQTRQVFQLNHRQEVEEVPSFGFADSASLQADTELLWPLVELHENPFNWLDCSKYQEANLSETNNNEHENELNDKKLLDRSRLLSLLDEEKRAAVRLISPSSLELLVSEAAAGAGSAQEPAGRLQAANSDTCGRTGAALEPARRAASGQQRRRPAPLACVNTGDLAERRSSQAVLSNTSGRSHHQQEASSQPKPKPPPPPLLAGNVQLEMEQASGQRSTDDTTTSSNAKNAPIDSNALQANAITQAGLLLLSPASQANWRPITTSSHLTLLNNTNQNVNPIPKQHQPGLGKQANLTLPHQHQQQQQQQQQTIFNNQYKKSQMDSSPPMPRTELNLDNQSPQNTITYLNLKNNQQNLSLNLSLNLNKSLQLFDANDESQCELSSISTTSPPLKQKHLLPSSSTQSTPTNYYNVQSINNSQTIANEFNASEIIPKLIARLDRKLIVLKEEGATLIRERDLNQLKGKRLFDSMKRHLTVNEFEKINLHADEIERVTKLILSLKARLKIIETELRERKLSQQQRQMNLSSSNHQQQQQQQQHESVGHVDFQLASHDDNNNSYNKHSPSNTNNTSQQSARSAGSRGLSDPTSAASGLAKRNHQHHASLQQNGCQLQEKQQTSIAKTIKINQIEKLDQTQRGTAQNSCQTNRQQATNSNSSDSIFNSSDSAIGSTTLDDGSATNIEQSRQVNVSSQSSLSSSSGSSSIISSTKKLDYHQSQVNANHSSLAQQSSSHNLISSNISVSSSSRNSSLSSVPNSPPLVKSSGLASSINSTNNNRSLLNNTTDASKCFLLNDIPNDHNKCTNKTTSMNNSVKKDTDGHSKNNDLVMLRLTSFEILIMKRNKLLAQLEDAQELENCILRKNEVIIEKILRKYYDENRGDGEIAEFRQFTKLKALLLKDTNDVADRIDNAEHQLSELRQTYQFNVHAP